MKLALMISILGVSIVSDGASASVPQCGATRLNSSIRQAV